MRNVLTEADYQVHLARTCAEALSFAQQTPLDLLIADVFLPDGSGIETFRQMRLLRPELAGIVVTGHSTWELALEALRAGIAGFLVKPIVPEQLLAAVLGALEQEHLRRENARLRALVPLYELSRAFMGTVALKDVLQQIVTTVRQETKAEIVSLMLLDDNPNELRIAASAGLPDEIAETQRLMLGTGIAGYVAQTGEPLILTDGLALEPQVRQAMTKPDVGSALSVPLKLRGHVIGVLNVSRLRGAQPFTHADLEFATVFAGQAAIAIDQTRLITEVRQLSEISQQLARTVDLEEACAVILHAPIDMIGARGTALWIIDGTRAPMFRSLGLDNAELPTIDIAGIREAFNSEPDVSWLTLPIQHGEKVLGALTMRLTTRSLPGEERMGTLRTFAHLAGATIESHRLRAREAQAFREVDRAVRADLNMRDLLDRLLNEMIETCQAEGGVIFLRDSEQEKYEPCAMRNVEDPLVLIPAVQQHQTYQFIDSTTNRYALSMPLTTGNRMQGVAVLVRPVAQGEFRIQQIELLSTLASAAALAVRNAQLYARSEEAAIAEERTRIAREIHDGLAQDLAYLVLKIGVAQKLSAQNKDRELRKELNDISDQLRRNARDIRRIIFALRPVEIETQGFMPALTRYVKEFAKVNDIEVVLNTQGDFAHLGPKLETALFRLTQETLNNIRKHAQAKHAWIDLTIEPAVSVRLDVRDDGIGFDLDQALEAAQTRGSVGIIQMRERAERAGGTFAILTAPKQGTRVQITLPIREA
jgi:signal transduction histidine kinase/FixJ family two-component response regulator